MRTLVKLSEWLAKQTPAFVTAVAVLAYFLPSSFGWVRGNAQTAILGVIMLAMGMTLTEQDFKILASRPLDVAIGAAAQFVLMPTIAFALAHALGLPRPVAVGLVLVGVCPGGVSSNVMSFLCKGDVAFSVGMTATTTLMAPLMTPLLMKYLAGELVDVDALGMFKSVLVVTLAPVALGFLLNHFFGAARGFRQTMKVMPGVAVVGLACIVGGVVSAQGAAFAKSGWTVFAAVFLHNSLGYAGGYATGVLARFSRAKKRTIAIEVGMQNAGLATVLATRHFPLLPEAAIAAAVSCTWHSISGALLAGVFNALDRVSAKSPRL